MRGNCVGVMRPTLRPRRSSVTNPDDTGEGIDPSPSPRRQTHELLTVTATEQKPLDNAMINTAGINSEILRGNHIHTEAHLQHPL